MSNQGHKSLVEFSNESEAEITEIAQAKIERMLLQKHGNSLVEFRVYLASNDDIFCTSSYSHMIFIAHFIPNSFLNFYPKVGFFEMKCMTIIE